MPYVKSTIKKDSLLTLPYSELLGCNWEPGWVTGYVFTSSKHSYTGQKVNTTESFSLHGFADCFNHHIGHDTVF